MKIAHTALWTKDLERSRSFYEHWFSGVAGEKYINRNTGFSSYFITFKGESRLEIMQMDGIPDNLNNIEKQAVGWAHVAFTVGDSSAVDRLTTQIRLSGFKVIGEPRHTGDGYYESVILDPDGNRVELVAVN